MKEPDTLSGTPTGMTRRGVSQGGDVGFLFHCGEHREDKMNSGTEAFVT